MIKDFDNVKTQAEQVHLSRYIISWLKSGGQISDARSKTFEAWLKSHELTDEEINKLTFMMECGRMELEFSATEWMRNHK